MHRPSRHRVRKCLTEGGAGRAEHETDRFLGEAGLVRVADRIECGARRLRVVGDDQDDAGPFRAQAAVGLAPLAPAFRHGEPVGKSRRDLGGEETPPRRFGDRPAVAAREAEQELGRERGRAVPADLW